MYIRDWGSVGQLDMKRPVVKSVEATSDRLNNERLRALPLTLIIQAGIVCDILFCAGQR